MKDAKEKKGRRVSGEAWEATIMEEAKDEEKGRKESK